MLDKAGLRLESLGDIGDHVFARSFAALLPDNPDRREREYARLELPTDRVNTMIDLLRKFGEFPRSGYVVISAVKPD